MARKRGESEEQYQQRLFGHREVFWKYSVRGDRHSRDVAKWAFQDLRKLGETTFFSIEQLQHANRYIPEEGYRALIAACQKYHQYAQAEAAQQALERLYTGEKAREKYARLMGESR